MQTLHTSCSRASWPGCLASFPGLVAVDVLVDLVGQQHDLAQRLAELAALVQLGDGVARARAALSSRARALDADVGRQLAAEALAEEARRAAGDVDVLADQVGVDARDEVLGVEVDVLDARVELGGDVVAQPFGVQAQLEVLQRAMPVPRLLLIFSPLTVMKPCT